MRHAKFRLMTALSFIAGMGIPLPWAGDDSARGGDVASPLSSDSDHWAFAPLQRRSLPVVDDVAWSQTSIDRFVASVHQREGLAAAPIAEARPLLRRLFFDLTGLPPTSAEVERFVSEWRVDPTETWVRWVDDLLGRLEFGERWGRHWLDVARYADSNGCSIEANNTHDNAWRYRDYVIDAFNRDKRFDEFAMEQVAGDLMESVSAMERSNRLIATGFLLLGPKAFGTGGLDRLRLDVVDEQIDSVGKAMLGMTLGCARCHDHKFDPFPTEDYYALAGIFSSTLSIRSEAGWRSGRTWNRVALPVVDASSAEALKQAHAQRLAEVKQRIIDDGKKIEQARQRLAELEKGAENESEKDAALRTSEAAQQRAVMSESERDRALAVRMEKVLPIVASVPSAMAVVDAEKPTDEAIRVGGDFDVRGETPHRGAPRFLGAAASEAYRVPPTSSGRLELARWLVDVDRGAGRLMARVQVNRIWAHLMGRPLVRSVDDFGHAGDVPSHPELLDHLAATLIDRGWSVKKLVREIVLTRVYRLSSTGPAESLARDPDNVWMARRIPRRLDAESLRDAVLALNGRLDRARGGSTLQQVGMVTIESDFFELDVPSPYLRRTVYLPIIRDAIGLNKDVDELTCLCETFNAANPNLVTGRRDVTTTPTQALLLLNSSFLIDQSTALAGALLDDAALSDDRQRVESLFLRAYARPADETEIAEALDYIAALASETSEAPEASGDPSEARARGWASLCQVVLGSNEFLFLD